ncbi:hypothetical protein PG997_006031 [Apiospora hydei]|uniref:AHC1-like C2H2 zinc-finger domain-containing protein n=1 Tax=Apiospora hydei TaxID=1337664 RepID=A0ABR1WMK0_9PEZI
MLMFRFWGSDSRGSDKPEQVLHQPMLDFAKPVQSLVSEPCKVTSPSRPPKRRRQSNAAIASHPAAAALAVKRLRVDEDDQDESRPKKKVALAAQGAEDEAVRSQAPPTPQSQTLSQSRRGSAELEHAKEIIQHQFSHDILLKHNELRLIQQELAKCQVALEQLRRCHLIPYPVNTPTPDQMLQISSGMGPALKAKAGDKVPQWAPPFGVTDGPYARHYAKWLIPDPKFDGIVPESSVHAESTRFRNGVESRSMRNSFGEVGVMPTKGRPPRGSAGQKLHALSNGYPQPKDKAGPCVLKRSDGKTVKLVCLDCNRENFSSTQGFINHCRIAHKRDFKSHEEAAVACGHPIEVEEARGDAQEEKPAAVSVSNTNSAAAVSATPAVATGLVHPFARQNGLAESEPYFSVLARIKESMDMFKKGQLPNVKSIPGVPSTPVSAKPSNHAPAKFAASADSPHLSRLLQSRGKSMDLSELVRDAKTKINLDEVMSPEDEDSEEVEPPSLLPNDGDQGAVMRMPRIPARTTKSPIPMPSTTRPVSSKGRPPVGVPVGAYATPVPTPAARAAPEQEPDLPRIDDEMELELSPNTAISNNAPSLVSDDGEYDDSVDGSSDESVANDSLDAESMSDVAEIGFDDDHVGPRGIRHHRGSTAGHTAVRLRKEDNKHVTIVSPVKNDGGPKKRGRPVKGT